MEGLERLWADEHDDGVPFRSDTDVSAVERAVEGILTRGTMNARIARRVRQWARWHWYVHSQSPGADSLRKQLVTILNLLVEAMHATEFYDGMETRTRTLRDGDGVRNTHNFIKACLIEEHVAKRSHLLDLGCGQGGDLRKFARRALRSYRGIDVSHLSIMHNRERMNNIRDFKCRSKLECVDFCETVWACKDAYNVVNCQFALQYAFVSENVAHFVIEQVAESLKTGGVFIGSVPVHPESGPFEKIEISLPGYEKQKCIEYSAPRANVSAICSNYGLKEVLWVGFDEYYATQREKSEKLVKRMRAFASPISQNAVFVYMKL